MLLFITYISNEKKSLTLIISYICVGVLLLSIKLITYTYLHIIITYIIYSILYYMVAQHNRLIDLASNHYIYVMFRRYIGHRRQHNNMFTRLNDI